MGKLLGPKGNSLKRLQEETLTKMAILGRGSMRDKHKVTELKQTFHRAVFFLNNENACAIEGGGVPALARAALPAPERRSSRGNHGVRGARRGSRPHRPRTHGNSTLPRAGEFHLRSSPGPERANRTRKKENETKHTKKNGPDSDAYYKRRVRDRFRPD